MTGAVSKEALFEGLGYGPPFDALEQALEAHGLSRPSKTNIDPRKERDIETLFRTLFVAVCSRGDCHAAARVASGARTVVPARAQADCMICGGSPTESAVDEMVAAWRQARLRRLCVVGGSPNAHRELDRSVAGRLDLRLVDGTVSRTTADAKADLAWADRVAVWGGTILAHKVSSLYKGPHVVQFAKRSIQELASEMAESARR